MRRLILTSVLIATLPGVSTATPEVRADGAAREIGAEATTSGASASTAETTTIRKPASTDEAKATEVGGATVPELAAPEPVMPPVPSAAVARSVFATDIDAREPVDRIDSLGNDHDRVFYFTEFVGVDGRELTHRWEYAGQVVAEVPIAIAGPRWRAYSSKNLAGGQLGEWKVSVVDESGRVVHTDSFVYEAAPEPEIADVETAPATPEAFEPKPAADEESAGPAAPALP